MPLFWFNGTSTSGGGSTGASVFSSGQINISGVISGLPAGQYAISVLPAQSSNHKLVAADPLPSIIVSSSVANGVSTATFTTTYAAFTRVVTW